MSDTSTPQGDIRERISGLITRVEDYRRKDESKWENSLTNGEATDKIMELVRAEVVKELAAAINAYNDYEEHRQEPSSDLKPGNLYLLDRIAALSSNQKEEK